MNLCKQILYAKIDNEKKLYKFVSNYFMIRLIAGESTLGFDVGGVESVRIILLGRRLHLLLRRLFSNKSHGVLPQAKLSPERTWMLMMDIVEPVLRFQ